MRRWLVSAAAIVTAAVIAGPAAGTFSQPRGAEADDRAGSPTGEVVVKFKSGATLADVGEALDAADATARESSVSGAVLLTPDAGQSVADAVEALEADADVAYAEPDTWVGIELTPNDTYYASNQWHYPQIGLPAAWDVTTGNSGVIVAVVDTGVQTNHPDLDSKITTGANAGYDFVNSDNNPTDDQGHGTFVAGIIGAETNNSAWVAGVCWLCKIMPVKVLAADGYGSTFNVAAGVDWARTHGADVINLSLGSGTPSATLETAVNNAWAAGITVVAATGNNNGAVLYPAAQDNIIAVGSNNQAGARSSFSNFGPQIDVMAPGEAVVSTSYPSGYGAGSGTSFATPHAAGVVGLMYAAGLTSPADIKFRLEFGATDMDAAGFDNNTGWGRINAQRAVDTADPTNTISAPANGATLSGAASVFSATVADAASGVDHVEFRIGATVLSNDTTAPYSVTWDTTAHADGPYALTADAWDNAGNQLTRTVNVQIVNNDTTDPTASITSPLNNATVSGAAVNFNATAADASGISKVRFWVGGTYLGYDTTSPYGRVFDSTTYLNGKYTLKIEAFDNAGNTAVVTRPIKIINPDSTPPSVSITAPAAAATVSGTVAIDANASDTQGMQKVQFWVDGVYLGFDETAPYTRSFDSTAYANGPHTLKARAIDWGGNWTEATVSVTVSNSDAVPPTVSITDPLEGATVSGLITITASASDNLGVSKVRFWVDTTYLSFDTTAPYTRNWDSTSVANGAHTIRVQAVDNAGNVSADYVVNVTVSN